MKERKYTLEELMGYTNGKSNYWEIHKNNVGHTRTLLDNDYDDFESWEDPDFLWFHMLERGLTFNIAKINMDQFMQHFDKTKKTKLFNSWSDEKHWLIQFREGGFTIEVPHEDMENLFQKISDTIMVSTYEQYVTHTGKVF